MLIFRDGAPSNVVDLLVEHKPGVLEAHPNAFIEWEALADHPDRPFANVKILSSTFDAIHPRTVLTILEASDRVRPVHIQLYGQSEVGPSTFWFSTTRKGVDADWRTVGLGFPGMTAARVKARGGKRPSPESPGFVEIKTSGRAVEYLNQPDRYQAQLTDGWWRMGDVGYKDRWGRLHLMDREIDYIPGFGSALEVEDALLYRLGELQEAVIIEGEGREPTPVVVTRDDRPLDRERWREATADLPPMAEPVQLTMDDVPRTATAKVRRLELARQLAGVGSPAGNGRAVD